METSVVSFVRGPDIIAKTIDSTIGRKRQVLCTGKTVFCGRDCTVFRSAGTRVYYNLVFVLLLL